MADIKAAYEKIGADYDDVLRRLSSEALVERFAGKFLQDQSFSQLEAGLAAGDAQAAFMAAHTLKGICSNLGLTNLYEPVYAITESLRGGSLDGADELLVPVREQYEATVAALS
jgi:histidine phosphotransfer protein HptB